MRQFSNSIFNLGYFLILTMTMLALLFLSGQLLLSHTFIPLEIAEGVEFIRNPAYLYPLLVIFLLLLLGSKFLLKKIPAKVLFAIFSISYLLAGIYLIVNNNGVLRADAKHVYTAALAFNQGDYRSLTTLGAYMYRNPHQLGLMTLERLYLLFSQSSQFIFGMNLGFVLLSNLLLYRITARLNKSDLVVKYTILLSFLFLPQLFFILFAYGTVPGLFFCLLSFYAFLLFQDKGSWWTFLLGTLSIGLACLLRNNYIIFALMLLSVHLLAFLKQASWEKVLVLFSIVASLVFSSKAIQQYYENLIGQEIGEGTPKIAYVTMALRDDPQSKKLRWMV